MISPASTNASTPGPALDVVAALTRHAGARPDESAMCSGHPCMRDRTMTWAELDAGVRGAAAMLAEHHAPGDVVMVSAPNSGDLVIALLGIFAADLVAFPVHQGLTQSELDRAVTRSNAAGIILADSDPRHASVTTHDLATLAGGGASAPGIGRDTARPLEHGGLLLQSSGTTGLPGIARRTPAAVDAVARNVAAAVGLSASDRVLAAIPLYHAYGVENALLAPVLAGAAITIVHGFDPAAITGALREQRATVFPGVPFMFQALAEIEQTLDVPALRCAYSAGAPLPPAVEAAFSAAAGVRVGQLYGATEIGSVTFNDPASPDFDPGCVGLPMEGVRLRIEPADDGSTASGGHLLVAAPSMLSGYVDQDAMHLVDGFFATGDIAAIDDAGRLTVLGRTKLQIEIGGLKVNPLEVEQVLAEHPDVRECVVVPLPVSATVNRLRAIVVPEGERDVDPAAVRDFARTRLVGYKVPRTIEVRQALPKSPTGKILRDRIDDA